MPIARCPVCKNNFVYDKRQTDYVHTCDSGNPTLDNEDKFDITSSFFAGMENKLQGTFPSFQKGRREQSITSRGNRVLTHKTRQRKTYIDLKTGTASTNPRA